MITTGASGPKRSRSSHVAGTAQWSRRGSLLLAALLLLGTETPRGAEEAIHPCRRCLRETHLLREHLQRHLAALPEQQAPVRRPPPELVRRPPPQFLQRPLSPSPDVNETSASPSPAVNETSAPPSPAVNETSPSPSPDDIIEQVSLGKCGNVTVMVPLGGWLAARVELSPPDDHALGATLQQVLERWTSVMGLPASAAQQTLPLFSFLDGHVGGTLAWRLRLPPSPAQVAALNDSTALPAGAQQRVRSLSYAPCDPCDTSGCTKPPGGEGLLLADLLSGKLATIFPLSPSPSPSPSLSPSPSPSPSSSPEAPKPTPSNKPSDSSPSPSPSPKPKASPSPKPAATSPSTWPSPSPSPSASPIASPSPSPSKSPHGQRSPSPSPSPSETPRWRPGQYSPDEEGTYSPSPSPSPSEIPQWRPGQYSPDDEGTTYSPNLAYSPSEEGYYSPPAEASASPMPDNASYASSPGSEPLYSTNPEEGSGLAGPDGSPSPLEGGNLTTSSPGPAAAGEPEAVIELPGSNATAGASPPPAWWEEAGPLGPGGSGSPPVEQIGAPQPAPHEPPEAAAAASPAVPAAPATSGTPEPSPSPQQEFFPISAPQDDAAAQLAGGQLADERGGGGVPIAAIVVPLVAMALLLAMALLATAWRRRRRAQALAAMEAGILPPPPSPSTSSEGGGSRPLLRPLLVRRSPGSTSVGTPSPSASTTPPYSPGASPTSLQGSRLLDGQDPLAPLLPASGELWAIPYSELARLQKVGEGSSGVTYRGHWCDLPVCVKALTPPKGLTGQAAEAALAASLQAESAIMARLRHPNCVLYLGYCPQPPCLVMEYCARGSLRQVMDRAAEGKTKLPWLQRVRMAHDVAKGMLALHGAAPAPILHRDLRSPNLLVDSRFRVKVSDFGLSQEQPQAGSGAAGGGTLALVGTGNPLWLAPEVLAGGAYTAASDVFSFGVVLWELLTLQLPWSQHAEVQKSAWAVASFVQAGERPAIPPPEACCPGTGPSYGPYISLIRDCWAQDPAARPGFEEVGRRLRGIMQQAGVAAMHMRQMAARDAADAAALQSEGSLAMAVQAQQDKAAAVPAATAPDTADKASLMSSELPSPPTPTPGAAAAGSAACRSAKASAGAPPVLSDRIRSVALPPLKASAGAAATAAYLACLQSASSLSPPPTPSQHPGASSSIFASRARRVAPASADGPQAGPGLAPFQTAPYAAAGDGDASAVSPFQASRRRR